MIECAARAAPLIGPAMLARRIQVDACKKVFHGGVYTAAVLLATGCTVLAIATTAASAAGTVISVGMTAGSVAVDAATMVAKGAVNAGGAVPGEDDID